MLQDFKQCKIMIFYGFLSIVSLFVLRKLIFEVLKELNIITKNHTCKEINIKKNLMEVLELQNAIINFKTDTIDLTQIGR